jgi:hypothetical protein
MYRMGLAIEPEAQVLASTRDNKPLDGSNAIPSRHALLDAELRRLRRQGKTPVAPVDIIADELRAAIWLGIAPEHFAKVWIGIASMADARLAEKLKRQLLAGLSQAAAALREAEAAVKAAQRKERKP